MSRAHGPPPRSLRDRIGQNHWLLARVIPDVEETILLAGYACDRGELPQSWLSCAVSGYTSAGLRDPATLRQGRG